MSNRIIATLTIVTLLAGSLILSTPYLSDLIANSGDLSLPEAAAASLPFLVDVHTEPKLKSGDGETGSSYLKINSHWMDNFGEMGCEECTMIEYKVGPKGFAGAAYQADEPLNFKDAKKVRFFAMGEKGGEKAKFSVAGVDQEKAASNNNQDKSKPNKPQNSASPQPSTAAISNSNVFKNAKFGAITEEVTLETDWTRYEISVEGLDLTNVDYPFGFVISQPKGGETKARIFLHSIVYEKEPASYNVLDASGIPIGTQNETLTVQLRTNATNATSGSTIEFNTNVSNGVEPYTYSYDFDDGQIEEGDNANTSHVFAEEGTFNVTAAVTDSENRTGTAFVEIEIVEGIPEQEALPAIEGNATGQNETLDQTANENLTDSNIDNNETQGNATEIVGNDSATEDAEDEEDAEENIGLDTNATSIEEPSTQEESGSVLDEEENVEESQNETNDESDDNVPPVAEAGNDLTSTPGGIVILDASQSSDQDSEEITYSWNQIAGPEIDIDDANSATPEITLPDENEDSEITLELTVSDGDLEDEDTVSIFIEYPEELEGEEIEELELLPASAIDGEWDASAECEEESDSADCMSDSSGGTFVFADESDATDLYSFEELDNSDVQIDRVVVKITAKKTGETGFVSFVADDPEESEHYSTLDISISSDSFEDYSYSWDSDPITGDDWTPDLLSSLQAGFRYTAGQSSVEISELVLVVSYHEDQPQETEETSESSEQDDNETETAEEEEEQEEEITEPPISEPTSENQTASNSTSDGN